MTNLDFVFKNPLLMLMYPFFFPHKMAEIRYQKKKPLQILTTELK
jgi:hypothetical protein